jgi:hypothetical protein
LAFGVLAAFALAGAVSAVAVSLALVVSALFPWSFFADMFLSLDAGF